MTQHPGPQLRRRPSQCCIAVPAEILEPIRVCARLGLVEPAYPVRRVAQSLPTRGRQTLRDVGNDHPGARRAHGLQNLVLCLRSDTPKRVGVPNVNFREKRDTQHMRPSIVGC